MSIVVREYEDDDLNQVNKLLSESFSIEKNNFNDDNFIEIVSCVDNCVSGYLLLTKILNPVKNRYYFLIDYVCVSSKYRGLGIGVEMLKYAEEISRKNDAMYMQLTCSYNRIAAHRLYEKCGFIKRDSDLFRKELL